MQRGFILFLLLSAISWVEASDYQSPRTASLGGAGHAGPLTNDAIYLNPSYTSFLKSYSLSGSFSSHSGGPAVDGRMYNVSLLDGRSQMFQAGAGYTVRSDGAWLHIGASKALVQRVGFGIGGKLILIDDKPMGKELNLSVTGIPSEWAQLSLTVDNLIQDAESLERFLYREIVLGSKFLVNDQIMIYVDPHFVPDLQSQSKFGWEAGVEVTAMKDVFLRAGHFRDSNIPYHQNRGRGLGLGAGWVGPRMSLDYAFQRVIESNVQLPPSNLHVMGMTVFF